MGLGHLLLAVRSEHDKYLVGNPQFTFFKGVYRRHTHFAMEQVFVPFVGDTTNTFGRKIYVDIPKTGDLLHRMYLVLDIEVPSESDISGICPTGYSFIDHIDLVIGGQLMERHYGQWLALYQEFFQDKRKEFALSYMSGSHDARSNKKTIYIPMRFWFNNEVGLSLPLIALSSAQIRLEVRINTKDKVSSYSIDKEDPSRTIAHTDLLINRMRMLCEYIHLDKEERVLFSSKSHEYLITQVQNSVENPIQLHPFESDARYEQLSQKVELRFNHPVKELIWTFKDSHFVLPNVDMSNTTFDSNSGVLMYNYWRNGLMWADHMIECNIMLNNKDLTEPLPASFFRSIQGLQHHHSFGFTTALDRSIDDGYAPSPDATIKTGGTGAYLYSFALNPMDYQPSGSVNFSKLENAHLKFRMHRDTANFTLGGSNNIDSKHLNIYGIHYNFLRIQGGQCGLLFAV
jgi:hypothetical protein